MRSMKMAANIITCGRIAVSLILMLTKPFSVMFYCLYVFCGISDMADGVVARKDNTESKTGDKLDSIADFIFLAVCLYKLLPVLNLSLYIWIWTAVIAIIKISTVICGCILQHRLLTFHTKANKITGFLLFLLPIAGKYFNINITAVPVCITATFAALQERKISKKIINKK